MSGQIAFRPGDVLAGKYRVERVLGQGGMGLVLQATHLEVDERVALKMLLPSVLTNTEAVARFLREAKAAMQVKNEHVGRVLDVGRFENGVPYMVIEFLDGKDLSHVIHERGALRFDLAIDYVLQACEAIAEAHLLGIVHRDLKPANLFLLRRADGTDLVKVIDFGISKMQAPGVDSPAITKTAATLGSPLYMSPEQMASAKSVDARSDIWALGTILFELITGTAPFRGDTLPELVASILQAPTPSARSRRPDVPADLDAVIARCLEKDPARRWPTVGALAVALAPFAPAHAAVSIDRASRLSARLPQPPAATLPLDQPTPMPAVSPTLDDPGVAAATSPSDTASSWGNTAPQTIGAHSSEPPPVVPTHGVGRLAVVGFVALAAGAVLVGLAMTMQSKAEKPVASAADATSSQPSASPPTADAQPSQSASPSAPSSVAAAPSAAKPLRVDPAVRKKPLDADKKPPVDGKPPGAAGSLPQERY